jgi:DNA (cytosine-5)-methyltransferase 3A
MNVLSLFDGMSCGQLALDRLDIKVDNYFASEVDKYAIQVAKKNYPNTKHIGDIRDIDPSTLPKIDLLIGGSPCQGFSVSGKMKGSSTKSGIDVTSLEQYLQLKEQGFEFDGQSYLFWEYVRIWKAVKPKYFFLENVRVTKKWLPMFNEAMGVEPIMINSALVSAQNRVRYYWTNIPNLCQPNDKGILLQNVLESGYSTEEMTNKGRSHCLTARYSGAVWWNSIERKQKTMVAVKGAAKRNQKSGSEKQLNVRKDEKSNCVVSTFSDRLNGCVEYPSENTNESMIIDPNTKKLYVREATKKGYIEVDNGECFDYAVPNSKTRRGRSMKDKSNCLQTSNSFMRYEYPTYRKLTPVECERLQTVPDGYTDCVSNSQRYKMLGNGWTIDVITHIFKNITL